MTALCPQLMIFNAMKCQMKTSINGLILTVTLTALIETMAQRVVAMCPRGCHCDEQNLRTVCEAEANLEFVPHTLNPALKQLFLYDNQIRSIGTAILSVYRNLEEFDLSRNQLTSLGEENFVDNKRLQKIVLTNNLLTSIDNNTFNGLTSLTSIYLNYNRIEEINDNVFRQLSSLVTLDLSHNSIKFISSNAFVGLKSLQTLNLRSNRLSVIPTDSFRSVAKLRALNLGSNLFTNISNDAFKYLTLLSELNLEDCSLEFIEDKALKGLNNLLILNLSHNNLKEIPSKAFSEVTQLEELAIGGNLFTRLEDKVLSNLIHLKTLVINESRTLSSIELSAFDGLSSLERLEISGNRQLSSIDSNALSAVPHLKDLVLRSNGFISLQLDFINTIERPIFLDVRDNPFHCNCTLEWLQTYFMRNNASVLKQRPMGNTSDESTSYSYLDMLASVSRVECRSPPALSSKLLIELERDELGCFELDTKVPIIIAILIGVLLILGVFIIFVICCKYGLSGLVKNQWLSGDNTVANVNHMSNDLNYRKPEFVFIPNIDLNVEESGRSIDEGLRYPLKMTPITEL